MFPSRSAGILARAKRVDEPHRAAGRSPPPRGIGRRAAEFEFGQRGGPPATTGNASIDCVSASPPCRPEVTGPEVIPRRRGCHGGQSGNVLVVSILQWTDGLVTATFEGAEEDQRQSLEVEEVSEIEEVSEGRLCLPEPNV